MNPHLTDELAQDLVDGLLAQGRRTECEAHAAGCSACWTLVESYRALGDALDGLEAPSPPPDFTDTVMECIEARERMWARERRLAFGIAAVVALLAAAAFAFAGASAWAPAVSRISGKLGGLATVISVGSDVLSPVVRALRVQIALGCTALGLPLLYALSRLVPRRAEAAA